jgi:hypothetical protein
MTKKEIERERTDFLKRPKAPPPVGPPVEEAGFVQDDNNTGRKVGSGRLFPPRWAEIERGCIHWIGGVDREDLEDVDTSERPPGYVGGVKPRQEVFDGFVLLWDKDKKDDADILAFASKWGALRRPFRRFQKVCKTDDEAREPLSKWRELSRHAWELREIAAVLRTKKEMTLEYWSKLMSDERALTDDARRSAQYIQNLFHGERDLDPEDEGHPQLWRGLAEDYLSHELQGWNAKFGPVSFAFGWRKSDDPGFWDYGARLDFGGSLLCYIGFQLGLVLVGGDLFICDACGEAYLRKRVNPETGNAYRKPNPGANNYCDGCGVKARNRIASANKRKRDKEKQTKET